MPMSTEKLEKKVLEDLERHGLLYALETIADEAPSDKLEELKTFIVEEFLRRKGNRIVNWNDNDFEGVSNILKDSELPFQLRLHVFECLLNYYSSVREEVVRLLGRIGQSTELYKMVKGLLILLENFRQFAEVKKSEEVIFPRINPPEPEPPQNLLNDIVSAIERSRQIILIGPPGTGKTHLAMWAAHKLTNEGRDGSWVLVQFHKSYRYDDFVERVVIKRRGNSVELVVENQIFVKMCSYAEEIPDKKFVLVIDEINRADVGSVFGELIYAIEYRGYPVALAYSGRLLKVPENLYIIATANDIDRGTFDIGVALRRRFEVIRIDASEEALKELLLNSGAPDNVVDIAVKIFSSVNRFFERIIGKKGLGHLFFRDVKDKESLMKVWRFRIKPLIEAYFLVPGVVSRDARQLIGEIESWLKKL
ncbi:MAG: AAA family ATPase [Desulfurococcales archaeon]|nr:AAA family ATPase [Desulfurococcales archaeon]